VNYFRIPIRHFLVIYDEVDLDNGVIRLRPAGGTAGHKGMESIQDSLGIREFPRLRLGIGRPPGRMNTSSFVLKKLKDPEMIDISYQIDRAVDAAFSFIDLGIQETMTIFNRAENL
jgi:PTH1 family peptidyl-tRNA hydrolase